MPVLIIIPVLQYAAVRFLPPGITEVPYLTVPFINLLATTRLLCIHDHRLSPVGSSTQQANNLRLWFHLFKEVVSFFPLR
jgi:hypothetical protein